MPIAVQQIRPLAPLPLVLGVLRRLAVARVVDGRSPPHPAHGLSTGHGVEALVLAMLDGDHALDKVGQQWDERGMRDLLQPGLPRASLHDDRWGHSLDALFAAHLHPVLSAMALKALAVYALPTPWLQQDTTTIALQGAYADEPKTSRAPRPAYGPSTEGRDALQQVLLRLGVSGDGGMPWRLGVRDGKRSDSVETPLALAECLALALEGVRGMVAASQAQSRRPLGVCLEHGIDLVTCVPRTCAGRQERAVWGRQPPALPLLGEKPGRTPNAAPRPWHGHSVLRHVAVEDSAGRGAPHARRFVVVQSSPLAQPHTHTYASAQEKDAQGVADHKQRVQARWFACRPDADTALYEYAGRGPGRRGRRPRPWRSHTVRQRSVAETRRTRHARRGRPTQTEPPPTASGSRRGVEVAAWRHLEEDQGWPVLATTVSAELWTEAEMLPAQQEQHTTGEPGVRWSKHPAAISPVWREKPARIAALAMLPVVGVLVYTVIQRQGRLHLPTPAQQIPGNPGMTEIPTAAVVLAFLAHVALIR